MEIATRVVTRRNLFSSIDFVAFDLLLVCDFVFDHKVRSFLDDLNEEKNFIAISLNSIEKSNQEIDRERNSCDHCKHSSIKLNYKEISNRHFHLLRAEDNSAWLKMSRKKTVNEFEIEKKKNFTSDQTGVTGRYRTFTKTQ